MHLKWLPQYIIRKRGLGDVLWIEPIVRKLASSNSKIIVYTKYPELFKGFPFRNIQFKKKLKTWEKILIGLDQYLGANLKDRRIPYNIRSNKG
jgi:hypothetical protein